MEFNTPIEFLSRLFRGEIYSTFDGLITVWTVLFGLAVFLWGLLARRLSKNHHTVALYKDQLRELEIKHVDLAGEHEQQKTQLETVVSRLPEYQAAKIESMIGDHFEDKRLDAIHQWLVHESPHLLTLCHAVSNSMRDLTEFEMDDLQLVERYCRLGLSLDSGDVELKIQLREIGRTELADAIRRGNQDLQDKAKKKIQDNEPNILSDKKADAIAARAKEVANKYQFTLAILLMEHAHRSTGIPDVDHRNIEFKTDIADWKAQSGGVDDALTLYNEILVDQERVLGVAHFDIIRTRAEIACWTGERGDVSEALDLFNGLLADSERVRGTDHPDTLAIRHNIAYWNTVNGNVNAALTLHGALLLDRERVLGKDHRDTLLTRSCIASLTMNDVGKKLALFSALLSDQKRVLRADHRDVLSTRSQIAFWTSETGDVEAALALSTELLADRERVLGADHPDTLTTRSNIASLKGENGRADTALALYKTILADRERVLGVDHPDTLATRNNIAYWTGEIGDFAALTLFSTLLADRERVLGADHPETLITRNNFAYWTGKSGDVDKALLLYRALLVDQERVLGADHRDVLLTRSNMLNLGE